MYLYMHDIFSTGVQLFLLSTHIFVDDEGKESFNDQDKQVFISNCFECTVCFYNTCINNM